jgi:hypothetical protein
MAKFIKSVLHAGQTYHSPDGKVTPTPQRLKHWADGFSKLTQAKYVVPADWDHGDTIDKLSPVKLSEQKKRRSAKNTVGHLSEFRLAPDGQSAEIVVEVTDPVAEGRADRNEVYISPVILDRWKDGHGTEYSDVITHVDFVNHPVDHSQGPFRRLPEVEPGSVALALRMGLSKPFVRMAEDDNPFAKKDGDGDGEAGEGEGEGNDQPTSQSQADPTNPADNPDMPPAKATDKSKLAAVMEGLSQMGLVLPSDFDLSAEGAIDLLLTSINTHLAAKREAEAQEAESQAEEEDEDMTVADPGYMAMSLYAENQHRDSLRRQLNELLADGRCTPEEVAAHEATISAIKLSLGADGKQLAKSDLEKFIEHRQAVPKGTFWTDEVRTKRMSAAVVEPPANMRGDMTRDEIENTANWALGRKPAAAK